AAMIALAIPFLGWFVGIVLLAASRAWTGREKAVAIAIALVPAVMLALGLAAATSSGTTVQIEPASGGVVVEEAGGSGLGPIELVVLLGTFLAGPLASVYLASRLRRSGEPGELASA